MFNLGLNASGDVLLSHLSAVIDLRPPPLWALYEAEKEILDGSWGKLFARMQGQSPAAEGSRCPGLESDWLYRSPSIFLSRRAQPRQTQSTGISYHLRELPALLILLIYNQDIYTSTTKTNFLRGIFSLKIHHSPFFFFLQMRSHGCRHWPGLLSW